MIIKRQTLVRWSLAIGSALLPAACDNNDDNGFDPQMRVPAETATFEITVTNLTNAQPLTPVAVIAHQDAFSVFTLGSPASPGLEMLAEGGDNSALIAAAKAGAGRFRDRQPERRRKYARPHDDQRLEHAGQHQ